MSSRHQRDAKEYIVREWRGRTPGREGSKERKLTSLALDQTPLEESYTTNKYGQEQD